MAALSTHHCCFHLVSVRENKEILEKKQDFHITNIVVTTFVVFSPGMKPKLDNLFINIREVGRIGDSYANPKSCVCISGYANTGKKFSIAFIK